MSYRDEETCRRERGKQLRERARNLERDIESFRQRRTPPNCCARKRGIEFGMIALPILGFVIAFYPLLDGYPIRVQDDLTLVRQATLEYRLTRQHCPTLGALFRAGELEPTFPLNDELRGAIVIACADDDVQVHASGPDLIFGTGDDLYTARPPTESPTPAFTEGP